MAKLLIETSHDVELLTEQTETGKKFFIEGIFAQAEKKNRNNRIYERHILHPAIDTYIDNYVSQRRAVGELNHPDRPNVDLKEAVILIKEMKWDGDNVYGKAQVLEETVHGKTVRGLMEAGFNMGVSTRAVGSLRESRGIKYVMNDLVMNAVDCVDKPSGIDCYVNGLVESEREWINENGIWIQSKPQIDEDLLLENIRAYLKETVFRKA